jgi:hypothetical protein
LKTPTHTASEAVQCTGKKASVAVRRSSATRSQNADTQDQHNLRAHPRIAKRIMGSAGRF